MSGFSRTQEERPAKMMEKIRLKDIFWIQAFLNFEVLDDSIVFFDGEFDRQSTTCDRANKKNRPTIGPSESAFVSILNHHNSQDLHFLDFPILEH
jgi:hypothetical protein